MNFRGFVGPSYTLDSVNIDAQRCINLYPQINEVGFGKEGEVASLMASPGLLLKASPAAAAANRGNYTATTGTLFTISGNKIYSADSSFNLTERGTLSTNSGQCSMADNGLTLLIVDGTYGYTIDLSTFAFATISDPDFQPADQVVYQDGYFILVKKNSQTFYISGQNATTFEALDTAEVVGKPDDLVAVISDHRDLWLFGSNSTEVFYNSGNNDFPFERIEGAFIEHGCAAPFAVAKMNNEVYWVGQDEQGDGIVYMARGYQPVRISTHAVEYAIRNYSSIADAVAYTYQDSGHSFYCLSFEDAETTWVYDSTTNLWHERAYTNAGSFERHRGINHAFAYGLHIVGDYENGKLYELSQTTYTDNGEEIRRRRACPHVSSALKYLTVNSIQVDMESGVGLDGASTVQGHDPQAMLRFSKDGGHTWSNEFLLPIGKIGKRKKRVIHRRLGISRDWVFELTISDPNKIAIIGAQLDAVARAS